MDLRQIPKWIKGHLLYDEEIINHRWNLCSGCEFLTEKNRCKKCGCYMQKKIRLSKMKCPVDKWGKA